jgi:hypothetical protein
MWSSIDLIFRHFYLSALSHGIFLILCWTRWNLIQLNFVDEMCSFNTKFMIFYKTKTQTFCLPYLL